MRRRGAASIAANPVLIGAATTLVVIVAVFLAYNANNGLPFVPTYELKARVPNAANLVRGNEVRVGGTRVGVIDEITPIRLDDGRTIAELSLKLETAVQPLPKDSTVIVRPRSALGLKYLEITKGQDRNGFATGATIPLASARPEPVEIDEFFSTFDEPTRAGMRSNTDEFGGALAGRGQSLNAALGVLPSVLRNVTPVFNNLSDRRADLRGFFRGLGQAAAETAPVADAQAALFRNLDTTFEALSDVRPDIQESIETGPAAMEAAIKGFPTQRAFLANNEELFRLLRPGVRALRDAAPDLADAFVVGQRVLPRTIQLNNQLQPTFRALQAFAEDPMTTLGINGLRTATGILRPTINDLAPTQTVCNYASIWFRNVASLLSEGDNNGTWQRFIIISAPTGVNNEGGPSSAPANGPTGTGAQSTPRQAVPVPAGGPPDGNFLHSNPYPNSPGGSRVNECEAGNEPWLKGRQVIGNVPGNQGTKTERTKIIRDSEGSLPSQAKPGDQVGGG